MRGLRSRLHYYSRAREAILPHLRGRPTLITPQTSHRKRAHDLAQVPFAGRTFPLIADAKSLLWAVHSGAHEFRVLGSRAPAIRFPSALLLQVSKGTATRPSVRDLVRLAFKVRDVFERLELASFVRTAPNESLIVEVPLNPGARGGAGFRETSEFAKALVGTLEKEAPQATDRGAALCWRLNEMGAANPCPYSLEYSPDAGVSTPLTWDELAQIPLTRPTLHFSPEETLRALEKRGDPFQSALTLTQYLPVTAQRWIEASQAA